MKKLKPWLLLIAVFVAGVIFGVVGTRQAIRHIAQRILANPDMVRDRMAATLKSDLDLTPEQQQKVEDILSRSHGELKTLRTEFEPRLTHILQQSLLDIRDTLTPEQQQKFDRLIARRKALWAPFIPPAK